ncbi:MAG: thioredoxin domain-containing protein, partial [Chitinophagaceae bacterium]
ADWNNKSQFVERTAALDKNKPVYIYCLGGGRSSAAAKWLQKNGFTTYNLVGGINAWQQAAKPVEGKKMVEQMPAANYTKLIESAAVVLVDFGAVWCPPCKKMEPIVDSLTVAQPKPFKLVKIDGANETDLCKRMNVEAFPTFIVYKNGHEVWRKQGIVSVEEFLKVL